MVSANPFLSVIIPTKNEEAYLPKLLESLKRQEVQSIGGMEIIVADAQSADNTRSIAQSYKAKVVEGGFPAYGRNQASKHALGQLLYFIDADAILPDNPAFLIQTTQEFQRRNLDIAGTLQTPLPVEHTLKNYFYNMLYEKINKTMKKAQEGKKPYMQICMMSKKEVYEDVGGFREDLEYGEDSLLAREAVKRGYAFGILESGGKVFASPRRFERGGIPFLLTNARYALQMSLGHEHKRKEKPSAYWKA